MCQQTLARPRWFRSQTGAGQNTRRVNADCADAVEDPRNFAAKP